MLVAPAADDRTVVHRALVTCAFACCALVIASFGLFARDQISGASKHQVAALASGTPTPPGVAPIPTQHAQPRRFIDGAARALTSPFRSLIQSNSQWVQEGVATICGLLVFGLGLGYLARYSSGLS
jgi:hypothetical protein